MTLRRTMAKRVQSLRRSAFETQKLWSKIKLRESQYIAELETAKVWATIQARELAHVEDLEFAKSFDIIEDDDAFFQIGR